MHLAQIMLSQSCAKTAINSELSIKIDQKLAKNSLKGKTFWKKGWPSWRNNRAKQFNFSKLASWCSVCRSGGVLLLPLTLLSGGSNKSSSISYCLNASLQWWHTNDDETSQELSTLIVRSQCECEWLIFLKLTRPGTMRNWILRRRILRVFLC